MTISDHDRRFIENQIYQHANDITRTVVETLDRAREAVREGVIEYAVRTNLDQAKAVELAREVIEHVEWGVRCHFIEHQRDRV